MPVTFTLVDTFTKLAVAKLPRLAFRAVMLPLKFAVLPANSKFTVKLLVVILLATLTKLAVARFPRLAFSDVMLPLKLPTTALTLFVTLMLLAFAILP